MISAQNGSLEPMEEAGERLDPVMVSDATPPMARALQLSFTGSGSEYFRIWAVNLLLTIVTLGLYRPWAKVRRLRYFYGNTVLDDHAFDFHGDPLKMLRGLLLVGAMLVVYSFARRGSPMASLVALLALAALAPALMRAAFQFRLGNTSWRGLRFRFHGDLAGAYRALIPAFIPGAAFLAIGLGVTDPLHPPPWFFKASGGVTLITLVLAPLIWWGLKRYQHGHMGLGPWRTTLKLGPMPVYALGLKLIGVMLLSAFLFGVLMAVLGAKLGMALHGLSEGPRSAAATLAITFAVGALVWLLILLVPMPFAISRAQNMIWDHTECAEVSFESRLGFWPLFGLTVQNWLLMAVTLGLYWPFAAVAMYRLKVESVTPQLRGDLDHLRDPRQAAVTDASGDFAGDLFGIDIGL